MPDMHDMPGTHAPRNPVLVGSRVYLRPMEVSDADTFARWDATEDQTFMYRGRAPWSPIHAVEELKEWYKAQPPENVEFAVCLKTDGLLMGSVGCYDLNWTNRTGETGSFLAPGYRNRGYGPEAKHLLLEYCFDRLQMHVLRSEVAETNTRSAAALDKQGYRPAGRSRWQDVKGGVYTDMLIFSVFRPDWLAARTEWLAGQAGREPSERREKATV